MLVVELLQPLVGVKLLHHPVRLHLTNLPHHQVDKEEEDFNNLYQVLHHLLVVSSQE